MALLFHEEVIVFTERMFAGVVLGMGQGRILPELQSRVRRMLHHPGRMALIRTGPQRDYESASEPEGEDIAPVFDPTRTCAVAGCHELSCRHTHFSISPSSVQILSGSLAIGACPCISLDPVQEPASEKLIHPRMWRHRKFRDFE